MSRAILKKTRIPLAVFLMAAMIATFATPSFAASGVRVEDVDYESHGKVEVEFNRDVYYKYKKPIIKVKSSKGVWQTAKYLRKDRDDIDFRLTHYKAGERYTFTIKSVKPRWGKGSYKTVTGKFSIPGGAVSWRTAREKALNHASHKYRVNRKYFYDISVERDSCNYKGSYVPIWEVEFETTHWEYECGVSRKTGTVLYCYREYDD